MPRTKIQNEQIREEKRKLIIINAMELFAINGFQSTTISEIAKKTKIAKGLLYNYFESKEDLLKIILNDGINEIMSSFDLLNKEEISDSDFRNYIESSFTILQSQPLFWKLYLSIIMQPTAMEILMNSTMNKVIPMMQLFEKYFEKKGYSNPKAEVRFFNALFDGISLNYLLDSNNFPIDESKQKIINMYLNN